MTIVDYTQHYKTIWFNYFMSMAGMVLILIMLIYGCVYCYKCFYTHDFRDSESKIILHYFSKESLIDFIGFVVFLLLTIFFVIFQLKGNVAKDLPYVINNDYSIVTGEIVKQGPRPEFGLRTVHVKNSVGQLVECKVAGATYELGNGYEIIYLPNTGFGSIIRQIE